ncbi:inorganic phosphate transporter [Nonomuraea terrae]|uniref:inorganic phosphate transporter n=1 Tax=Nonomuraea terrae TaxID=2530383 RepID=UPI002482F868|nr:inorganic phosphate transporter [Nonomuraea terrae]
MPLDVVVLALIAGLFAVVSGTNDGGALLATGLKLPTVRPATGILTLVVLVAVIPLFTHQVALTFVTRLASFEDPGGRIAMAIAVVASLAVVMLLSMMGRPTSLTLAIVGGLTGAGLGWGLPVSPGSVALVLAFGVAAPIVGGLLGWAMIRVLVATAKASALRHWHWAGFLIQTIAYAANDGQKMLAVFMVALGFSGAPVEYTVLVAVLFGLGTMYGLPKAGRTLSREIIVSRPPHGVAAEFGAGAAVMACAAVGMPVSMTQAVAGGLIGAGVSHGGGRVRWYAATKIAAAWLMTLPASGVLGWCLALLVKGFASLEVS